MTSFSSPSLMLSSSTSSQSPSTSVNKFKLFQTSDPVSIRATYGPFSTKKTVLAKYIVPNSLNALPSLDSKKINESNLINSALLEVKELNALHLDMYMSAYIVIKENRKSIYLIKNLIHLK